VFWLGLGLALVSALAVNWAYSQEHDAAAALPPLSLRQPIASARLLLGSRDWLLGFGFETGGWIVYVVAVLVLNFPVIVTLVTSFKSGENSPSIPVSGSTSRLSITISRC